MAAAALRLLVPLTWGTVPVARSGRSMAVRCRRQSWMKPEPQLLSARLLFGERLILL
ncbi:hypothetical protein JDF658_03660 [Carboxydocella sp. JDF658]|nr:hypothetical protein JDF658_03660 [Carboxydocella sp. JDF658]